jgi:ribosomal protein S18 acetylase RimI-like enzyme
MLAWLADRAGELARERREAITLQVRVRAAEATLVRLLAQHGYALQDRYTIKYRRSLDDPIPVPPLPDGFAIRHVAGEAEAEACAALHREAFGTPHMQAHDRIALMRDPGYVPDLDLVAVASDGALAAFVRGGIDREQSRSTGVLTGYTDPVGTHPAYRKRGLAWALLCEAFRRLRGHGVRLSFVATGSWNLPMQRLAESVGYAVDDRLLTYAKTFA